MLLGGLSAPVNTGAQLYTFSFWADIATMVGLVLTLFVARRARTAAEAAETAARDAKEKVMRQSSLVNFASAISVMEDLMRLHRGKEWAASLERHPQLRRMLLDLREGSRGISPEQQTVVSSSVLQLKTIQELIEKHLSDGEDPPKVDRLNNILNTEIEKLYTVSSALKNL